VVVKYNVRHGNFDAQSPRPSASRFDKPRAPKLQHRYCTGTADYNVRHVNSEAQPPHPAASPFDRPAAPELQPVNCAGPPNTTRSTSTSTHISDRTTLGATTLRYQA
jgi:hypothetical protein